MDDGDSITVGLVVSQNLYLHGANITVSNITLEKSDGDKESKCVIQATTNLEVNGTIKSDQLSLYSAK